MIFRSCISGVVPCNGGLLENDGPFFFVSVRMAEKVSDVAKERQVVRRTWVGSSIGPVVLSPTFRQWPRMLAECRHLSAEPSSAGWRCGARVDSQSPDSWQRWRKLFQRSSGGRWSQITPIASCSSKSWVFRNRKRNKLRPTTSMFGQSSVQCPRPRDCVRLAVTFLLIT